ncbi:hypothetical protein D3C87_1737320 [compost metagenome]
MVLGSQTAASGASSLSRNRGSADVSRMIRFGVDTLANMLAAASMPPLLMRKLTFAMRRSWPQRSISRCTASVSQNAWMEMRGSGRTCSRSPDCTVSKARSPAAAPVSILYSMVLM